MQIVPILIVAVEVGIVLAWIVYAEVLDGTELQNKAPESPSTLSVPVPASPEPTNGDRERSISAEAATKGSGVPGYVSRARGKPRSSVRAR